MNKISFIIPIYNCERFVEKNIIQIQKLSMRHEIILVDDGSSDDSGKICDKLAQGKKHIRCLHQQNQGVSAARNKGLELASGEYVVFLDADDDIEPEKLQTLLEVLEKDDTIDMVVFGLSFDFYYRGELYRRDELSTPFTGKQESHQWIQRLSELYETNSLSPIWNKIIKRSILIENDLKFRKDMFLYEDLEYSLRIMSCCNYIYFSPEVIYHYRQAEDEGNAGRRLKRIEHIPTLIIQIEDALDELFEKKHIEEKQIENKSILLTLYLVLAREKISVSDTEEIRKVCNDFIAWFESREFQMPSKQQRFINRLMKRDVCSLILNRTYTAVRHKFAVAVKNTGIYQRLRG